MKSEKTDTTFSKLHHRVIRVNGLPFSKKKIMKNNSSPRGTNHRWVGNGGGIRGNRRWEDYGRRERKGREVGVLKRGLEGVKEKKMLLNISQSKKKKPGFEPGKHWGCGRCTELFLKHPYRWLKYNKIKSNKRRNEIGDLSALFLSAEICEAFSLVWVQDCLKAPWNNFRVGSLWNKYKYTWSVDTRRFPSN